MRTRSLSPLAVPAVVITLSVAACESPGTAPEIVDDPVYASVHAQTAQSELLRAVRQATAPFHSHTRALEAGYEPDDHCVAVPGLGGMGHHWANQTLVDPVFDPLQPEAVLYAPGRNGQLQLVAVEYIVIDVGQDHPHFGDRPLDVGGTPVPVDHWSLHVWLYEGNPEGMFTPFNPNVSCP